VAAILLGAFKSNLPIVQYLGNTTGVLLGFVLGIWWQETERERIHKEQEAEKSRIHQTKVQRFWNEYKAKGTFSWSSDS
jgi:membrane protein YqaA with SNARE-associated domain